MCIHNSFFIRSTIIGAKFIIIHERNMHKVPGPEASFINQKYKCLQLREREKATIFKTLKKQTL